MDRDNEEQINFLEQQLQWCKKQELILKEIDEKLHEMKRIAEFAQSRILSLEESKHLNEQLAAFKEQISQLERQLKTTVH